MNNVIRACMLVGVIGALSLFGGTRGEAAPSEEGFSKAHEGYRWQFPQDHSAHEGFRTEWWYYTGQLYTGEAVPFRDEPSYGFQLTFFRRGLGKDGGGFSEYLAHVALTDIKTGRTTFSQRKGGGLLGAAGAAPSTLQVWSGDWLAELIGDTHLLRFSHTEGSRDGASIRLLGVVKDPPWLQGAEGYSKKGMCESCASMYYSVPRIPFEGEVRERDTITKVRGLGWMDHEFMSNKLAPNQVGWDWFGLMLKDGRNLMVFRLRDATGKSSYSSATLWRDGVSVRADGEEIYLEPESEWTSPVTGGRYPLSWRIQIPRLEIDLSLKARTSACEVGSDGQGEPPRYWEGPVASQHEEALGYLEMTGYAGKVSL